jgi:hypothetical protein
MTTELIPIEVECHSGYKADEYPKCFYWDNNRFEIQQVTDSVKDFEMSTQPME